MLRAYLKLPVAFAANLLRDETGFRVLFYPSIVLLALVGLFCCSSCIAAPSDSTAPSTKKAAPAKSPLSKDENRTAIPASSKNHKLPGAERSIQAKGAGAGASSRTASGAGSGTPAGISHGIAPGAARKSGSGASSGNARGAAPKSARVKPAGTAHGAPSRALPAGKNAKSPAHSPAIQAKTADKKPVWLEIASARSLARQKHKPIFVDFYTDWCSWCQFMDRTTFEDEKVQKFLAQNFICSKLNAQDGAAGEEIAQRYAVDGYPTFMVFDSRGQALAQFGGFKKPDELLSQLNEILKPGASKSLH